jgi:uncharacterized integral membrane protein
VTQDPRSAGSTLRRFVAAIILVPLAIVLIAFAVANRQDVTISLDPFNPSQPAYATKPLWLFVPILAALILGVLIGGITSWFRHGKSRRMARRFEREVIALRAEIATLRRRPEALLVPPQAPPPERLQLKPPVR